MKATYSEPSVLLERSDFDRDLGVNAQELGEDWGDGFFVSPELVVVDRDVRTGRIVRTTPLSEVTARREALREDEIMTGPPLPTPGGLMSVSAREKLVTILAKRMFEYYSSPAMMSDHAVLNPLRDGIPVTLTGEFVLEINPEETRHVVRKRTSPGEVMEWIKALLAKRTTLVNRKNGWTGWNQPITSSTSLRIKG
jgi:hypothetical protein